MNIAKILDRTDTVPFPIGDETLNLVYRPSVFQDTFLDEELDELSLNQGLAKVLADWDLFEGEGDAAKKVPVSEAVLAEHFDRPLKRRMWKAIQEHAFPN